MRKRIWKLKKEQMSLKSENTLKVRTLSKLQPTDLKLRSQPHIKTAYGNIRMVTIYSEPLKPSIVIFLKVDLNANFSFMDLSYIFFLTVASISLCSHLMLHLADQCCKSNISWEIHFPAPFFIDKRSKCINKKAKRSSL